MKRFEQCILPLETHILSPSLSPFPLKILHVYKCYNTHANPIISYKSGNVFQLSKYSTLIVGYFGNWNTFSVSFVLCWKNLPYFISIVPDLITWNQVTRCVPKGIILAKSESGPTSCYWVTTFLLPSSSYIVTLTFDLEQLLSIFRHVVIPSTILQWSNV